jgi:arylsulfatase A-like enzyme
MQKMFFVLIGWLMSTAFATAADKPNILLVFSDDHAVRAISAYDTPEKPALIQTPNLDRLAKQGVIFDRSYCANSICGPSRSTILTGLHSYANGMLDNMTEFDGSQQTFPKLLQQAGYKTAIRGKWHLKSEPTGFDSWMVYKGQGQYYNPIYRTPEGEKQLPGYSVDTTTDLGIKVLEDCAAEPNQPFYLAVQFKGPHRPWLPPLRYLKTFDDTVFPEPPTLFDDYAGRPDAYKEQEMSIEKNMSMLSDLKVVEEGHLSGEMTRWMKGTRDVLSQYIDHYAWRAADRKAKNLSGADLVRWKYQAYLRDYLGTVKAVDENVGRLLDALDRLGLADNTLVVYSSDQGFYLGEHGWFDKRWMLEESYRMPLMMRWPGHIPAGQRCDALVQNIDYAPTFCDLSGITPPEPMHGVSLRPLMEGERPADWRKSLYYFYYEFPKWHHVQPHYGVSDDRYKLIHFYMADDWQLIDLQKDPDELKNFIEDPAYREERDRLYAELLRLRRQYQIPEKLPNPTGKWNKGFPTGDLPELPSVFPN